MSIMHDSTVQTKVAAAVSATVSSVGVFGVLLDNWAKVAGLVLSLLLIAYWIRKDRREVSKEKRQEERHDKDMEIKNKKLQSLKSENKLLKKKINLEK